MKKETTSRALLYGGALTLLGALGALWADAHADAEADVTVLLDSARVQLQAAYLTPAADLEGEALSSRVQLIETVESHLESVERRRPGLAVTAEFRGFAHMLQGEFLEAAACYRRARSCEDCGEEQRDVLAFNEARMYVAAGDGEAALGVLSEHRASLDARYGHRRRLTEAKILATLGREREALRRLTIVTADGDVSSMASVEAAEVYLDLEREAEAEALLQRARADAPIADYLLARLKLREGDVDSSFERLARAYEARPAEVRRRLRDEAGAWSAVAREERFQQFGVSSAAPGR